MNTKRKMLLWTRHGDTSVVEGERQDSITPESIIRLYKEGGAILRPFILGEDVKSNEIFLRHTKKKRTHYTLMALLARAFDHTLSSLEKDLVIPITDLDIAIDPRLDYEDIKFNEEALERDLEAYTRSWISDPTL